MLADMDGGPIHEFERHGDDAGGDDGGDAGARGLVGVEAEQHRARAFGRLDEAHRDLGDDAELALRADDQRQEIVTGRIEARSADIDDLAVHQHHADAEHIIGGDAVFQAMGAAGIGGDIAADGAGDLARRVRRVEEAVSGDRLGNGGIGDAGLDPSHAVHQVERQNFAHAGQAQHDGVLERQGAAAERGAGPARHDLDVVLVAEAQDGAHLLGRRRQHHRHRQAAIGGERVGLEGAAAFLVGDQGRAGRELLQLPQNVGAALKDREIRAGHGKLRHPRLRARPRSGFEETGPCLSHAKGWRAIYPARAAVTAVPGARLRLSPS